MSPHHLRTARALTGRTRLALAVGLFLLFSGFQARADLLYFLKGGEVQASASAEGDRVVVELPGRTYEFQREDFRKRVPGFMPAEQWGDRLKRARRAAFPARFEAAWWASRTG